jgi:hypothetical protein
MKNLFYNILYSIFQWKDGRPKKWNLILLKGIVFLLRPFPFKKRTFINLYCSGTAPSFIVPLIFPWELRELMEEEENNDEER